MVRCKIYVEGGGDKKRKPVNRSCRAAFGSLFERSGFKTQMIACGGRDQAYSEFKAAHDGSNPNTTFVAMLVDSEDPVDDIEKTWDHVYNRDNWKRPASAADDQVFLMTTTMETWIVADRKTLKEHYGSSLRDPKLTPLHNLEDRPRKDVFEALKDATKNCGSPYAKGINSCKVLEKLDPDVLKTHLPSFKRVLRILEDKL